MKKSFNVLTHYQITCDLTKWTRVQLFLVASLYFNLKCQITDICQMKQFLIRFTLNFHLDQDKPRLSMERFPFGPSKDSISISIKKVKVGFCWAVER